VTAMVQNLGDTAAPEFSVGFVFANNAELTSSRIDSGASCEVAALAPGASAPCVLDVPVPASLASGTYFLGAVADASDAVVEKDETNNDRASAQPVVVQGLEPTPTPTLTRTPTLAPCGPTREGSCGGACPNQGEACVPFLSICRCVNLFPPTATPTPPPQPACGLSFPACNGSCPRGQFCLGLGACRCTSL
jgi:CARDB